MRRLLIGPVDYLAELTRSAVRGWGRFFFTPADPTPLGVVRVLVGALSFWNLLCYGFDLGDFLGPDGWADLEALRRMKPPLAWSFWTLVPGSALWSVWGVCLVVLALFTVGLFSRTTAVLAWVIAVSTARRAPVALFGFDQAIGTWTLYLAATGASGQAVSLDRFLGRWKTARAEARPVWRRHEGRWRMIARGAPPPTVAAALALRLLQLHLCLIYGSAGLAKLQGAAWWTGRAVWSAFAAAEFRLFDLTWLATFPWLIQAMTHASLALEIGYPAVVWVRRLRPLALALVLTMHALIGVSLGLVEFALAMAAGNLAFASGEWLRGLVAGPESDRSQPVGRLLYDGSCPRCRRTVALVLAADPDRLIEPVDQTAVDVMLVHPRLSLPACQRAIHLVGADGRVWTGFDALVRIARWFPLFWPFGLVASVPGVTWLGRRAYNGLTALRVRGVSEATARGEAVCLRHGPVVMPTLAGRPS